MRFSSKPLLLALLSMTLVIGLAAFGYSTGVQAQVAAPTGSATMTATMSSTTNPSSEGTVVTSATSMNTATGGGASGTGSTGLNTNTTVYPPCPANSASGAATLAGQSTAEVTTGTGTAMPQATIGASATAMPQATMAATMSAAGTASGAAANPTASGSGTAYLGITAAGIDNCGMSIIGLIPGGPALAAGLQVGDVIVAVGGQSVTSIYTNYNSAAAGASGSIGATSTGNAGATIAATMNAGAT